MKLINKRCAIPMLASAVIALTLVGARSASAQGNFATFTQSNTSSSPFVFTNTGSTSTLTASSDVVWNWLITSSDTTANTSVNATMTFTSTVASTATTSTTGIQQVRQSLNITDLIFRDKATGKVLLDVATPQAASLIGQKNTATGNLTASGTTFTSDFLTFGSSGGGRTSLALAAINPTLKAATNQYLTSFNSSGTGTFANTTRPVPEMGTVLSLGTMLTGSCMFGVKRRRKGAPATAVRENPTA